MTTDWRIGVYGTSLTGEGRRTSPTSKAKKEITAKQEGRCLYCRIKIGATVRRNDKPVAVRPAWDHFVPFLYSRRNPRDGWVLACTICNAIKGCSMFSTVADAQKHIIERRAALGYETIEWSDTHGAD